MLTKILFRGNCDSKFLSISSSLFVNFLSICVVVNKLMQTNDTSSDQKLVLKCKPFTALSAQQLPHSSKETASSRRSTRLASRTNDENDMEGSQQNVQINQNGVQYSSSDDNVIVRKRKANHRRSQNRIQSSSDDDGDDFVSKSVKKRSPKKRRSESNVQADGVAATEPKRKPPIKRRKPLLTIKCGKITDYFGKSTTATVASNATVDPIEGTVRSAQTIAHFDFSNLMFV